MGTRGAIGFRLNDTDKVSYNHFDSYPSALGTAFVNYTREFMKDREALIRKVKALVLVKEDERPTPEEAKALKQYTDTEVGTMGELEWYSVLRNLQGDLPGMLNAGYMIDSHLFLNDSLLCEYAYILNLDTNMAEFYKGFNHDLGAPGRYAARGDTEPDEDGVLKLRENGYAGVALAFECPADAIPDDWMAKAYPEEEN